MNDRWKLATMAIALVLMTALVTSVTTASLSRPTPLADAAPVATAPARHVVTAATAVPPVARRAPASVQRVAYEPAPAVTPVSDCASGGDRALRVAKPGAIGALIGAGVGAAGGAIADGGKAAGKGALIGGLAGAGRHHRFSRSLSDRPAGALVVS